MFELDTLSACFQHRGEVVILFKYPTRGRPTIFKDTLGLYYSMLSGKYDYKFLISADEDDATMNNDRMRDYMDKQKNLRYVYGHSRTKVQAINADMEGASFDILALVSDDMRPIAKGYDEVIVNDMMTFFPKFDGALHFNDGTKTCYQNISQVIMGVNLYRYFGYIYHPDYKSLWCDNEFTDVVRNIGRVIYDPCVIIRHFWVDCTGTDELHRRNESLFNEDRKVYELRKSRKFPKGSCL